MAEILKPDLCIIGAGSGGLSLAASAVMLGASVVLIEEKKMGGDCLNTGCVPSKSLIESARLAQQAKTAEKFGVAFTSPSIDYQKVNAHVHSIINSIAPNDSIERFTKLGVKVIQGHAQFKDAQSIVVNEQQIQARFMVIATGSIPSIPPISGLSTVPYYTNETIFDLAEKPQRLLVIGGGPLGCELAQAYALLGTSVTLFETASILAKDDQSAVEIVRQQMLKNDIDLIENVKISRVSQQDNLIKVHFIQGSIEREISGSHLLIATGRQANIGKLNLLAANIVFNENSIQLDSRLRTTNKKVYAIGDVARGYQFTHVASYHASVVIKNIFFKLKTKANYDHIPWVTFTTPELAQVGLTEPQARAKNLKITVTTESYAHNDRAQAERQTLGMIKIITDRKGKILGATIVGHQAGELIFPWVLAIQNNLSIKHMASVIAPYPTLNELNKRVASNYFIPLLQSKWLHFLLKVLKMFG